MSKLKRFRFYRDTSFQYNGGTPWNNLPKDLHTAGELFREQAELKTVRQKNQHLLVKDCYRRR